MDTLSKLYSELDFLKGDLLSATDSPKNLDDKTWIEKGEWLSAAKRAGADKVFFIENNPIVVFAECEKNHSEKIKTFNRIWSLARPRLLFLASPGEITVCDLAQKPIDISNTNIKRTFPNTLEILHDVNQIAVRLQNFHRNNIESGKIFEYYRFGDIKNRADKSLIRDLKTVRRELINMGLDGENVKYAHSLIGRSIFIRYLEDRKILTKNDFLNVAQKRVEWKNILNDETTHSILDLSENEPFYPRILQNKEFTYALFNALASLFNGDMFSDVDKEEATVKQKHLCLLHDLLYGETGIQKKLFFYSYRFDIVPLDLISSIYEEFYHHSTSDSDKKSKFRQDGVFYTPPVLAEFVLSNVLTPETLKKNPRVLDPACGSGIFLVEAFRRIVRYNRYIKRSNLTFDELKNILKNQISGIEANEEAARITAFSLYLSMLHYLDPPSINEQMKRGNTLPNLVISNGNSTNNFHCIWIGNAFNVKAIQNDEMLLKRFGKQSADVVIGNPPWGKPDSKADEITKKRHQMAVDWCLNNNKPISNKESSQAFLWRVLDFLTENGVIGMLVSAGVLFKNSNNSESFRKDLFSNIRILSVYNFSHVRDFFFKSAISPFIAIFFSKSTQNTSNVKYYSAKQIIALKETQAILLSSYDKQILRDDNLACSDLWKSHYFGRSEDHKLIKFLQRNQPLSDLMHSDKSGRGYQVYTEKHDYKELDINKTVKRLNDRYDSIMFSPSPSRIYNLGPIESYHGKRLLINEGILERGQAQGQIISRFEEESFTFSRSIYGIKLKSENSKDYKLILGILWSSLCRYYYFMTSANWGLWYHKVLLDELIRLPIVLDNNSSTEKIIFTVDKLRGFHPLTYDIMNPSGLDEKEIEEKRHLWETELDEAVFDLYGFNDEQKDLVRDFCEVTLPFFYKPLESIGTTSAIYNSDLSWIESYINTFARRWNTYLGTNEVMRAEIHTGAHMNMLAIEFFPMNKNDKWKLKIKNDSWDQILEQLGNSLPEPLGVSQIVIDGLVHVISSDSIIIIKRNIKRFWTRSLAREDAEITLYKAMQKDGLDKK